MVTDASHSGRTAAGPAARAVDLTKTYGSGDTAVRALDGVNVEFERGRFTAVMGPSGSGKSTLMHCMAGLDAPTAGRAFIGDEEIGPLDDAGLTELRRDRVGFVFQSFNLVPTLTRGGEHHAPRRPRRARRSTGRGSTISSASSGSPTGCRTGPSELSGGQQQRVACARALIGRPELIFADEPTGNLDSNASAEVLAFLRQAVDRARAVDRDGHPRPARGGLRRPGRVPRRRPGGGRAGLADGRRRARADEASWGADDAKGHGAGPARPQAAAGADRAGDRARGHVRHRDAGPGRHAEPHVQRR